MNLLLLLDMAAAGRGDEVAVRVGDDELTTAELLAGAWAAAGQCDGASALAYVGPNGLAVPLGLFAAAAAGVPFVPLNYRLGDEQLHDLLLPLGEVLVVADGPAAGSLAARGHRVVTATDFMAAARAGAGTGDDLPPVPEDSESPAVLLYTSGTTAAPKAAVLRHRHLTSYVIGAVEFGGAEPDEAALVSVPPYHVAGMANLISNLYLGRRIVYLPQFDADRWVATVRAEGITNAMVVPTMLARICDALDASRPEGSGAGPGAGAASLPTLRAMSYGGARTPAPVLQRVMDLLPDVALTNAYGLTETSSTIAVLGPDDHRAARDGDPVAVARLASAGRVLPTVEVQIRGDDGVPLPASEATNGAGHGAAPRPGEIWVRGDQVSGEYAGRENPLDPDGWFPTKDRGWIDVDGYLFIEGRSDDTIIRGGENIAPAEIEEVLLRHPAVDKCAVVGVPDDEWGQRIAAVVVLRAAGDDGAGVGGAPVPDADDIREFARRSLRSSKTPELVRFVDELPYTETGKLIRRAVLTDLVEAG